jgi:putrescine transport system ATP-binding protein
MTMAHRIAVMDHGRITQVGTPVEVYEQPNSRHVAEFVGDVTLIEGVLSSAGDEFSVIDSKVNGRVHVTQRVDAPLGATVWVALRPEKIRVTNEAPDPAPENCTTGTVSEIGYLGDISIYKVQTGEGFVMKSAVANVKRRTAQRIATGDRVWVSWSADAGIVLTR